ncbi:hypothetical protein [Corticibacter populi]|uniref:hypothetical protein n=1 Tax=Corticibacter populi TaxID=1550736 RepID=UPI00102CC327|nr:hypothetical protein [Corticibacter populi]
MNNAQEIYRHNHRGIRALARHEALPEKRSKCIQEACASRLFWDGDKYSRPAHPAARAARQALIDRTCRIDWVQRVLDVFGAKTDPAVLKAACVLRRASYGAYRNGRLPA